MAWQDDLREAAYTPPSGGRLRFTYENVSKSVTKKTSAFNFPDAEGTFVQDLGRTGRRYPLRMFFWGDNYISEVEAFESALLEIGIGELEHPVYGTIKVIPFGEIKRRDDLKTDANQAILEVIFWETIDLLFPTGQTDPGDSVLTALDDFNAALAEQTEGLLDTDLTSELITFKNRFLVVLDVTQSALQTVADTQDDVRQLFNTIFDSINSGIDVLVSEPLTLIFQTAILIQTPARALANIQARLDAYANLATNLITGDDAVREPGLGPDNANAFITDNVFASTAVTGTVLSAINNEFATKPEALAAAEAILDLLDQVAAWQDDNFQAFPDLIDTGEAYQQLEKVVALTAGFLVEISFTLKQERRLILSRPRSIIDLVFELYGEVDEQLDFFINSNNLTGSEIIELPKDKEIVYFV